MASTPRIVRAAAVQIAPDFDRPDGTLDRVCSAIDEAAAKGAQLAVFPETFVPYYPYFSFVLPPVQQGAPHLQLMERAVVVPGPVTAAVAERARAHGMVVVLGVNERDHEVVDWLADMRYYEMPVTEHPLREGVRDNTNHYVTGRDGGRDIDLRRFALEGMELYGLVTGFEDGLLAFQPNLREHLDHADRIYNGINASIDRHIEAQGIDAPPPSVYQPVWEPPQERSRLSLEEAGITSVLWCIGFAPDFGWLDAPVFNGRGAPVHRRGITGEAGLYFLGLPWLHTWGSGRFSGVARDAEFLALAIEERQAEARQARSGNVALTAVLRA